MRVRTADLSPEEEEHKQNAITRPQNAIPQGASMITWRIDSVAGGPPETHGNLHSAKEEPAHIRKPRCEARTTQGSTIH